MAAAGKRAECGFLEPFAVEQERSSFPHVSSTFWLLVVVVCHWLRTDLYKHSPVGFLHRHIKSAHEMHTRKDVATLTKCPLGGPGNYTEVVSLYSSFGQFSITTMPEGMFRDFLRPPRGSGCEFLYKICDSVQQSLRPMYHIWPNGLTWGNTCGNNTAYILKPHILDEIEAFLDRDLYPFIGDDADRMHWEDAANIVITNWKGQDLFGNVPHQMPIGSSYHSLVYLEIKGRFGNETNTSGLLSSMHLAVETTGYAKIIGFYAASSLPALRDLVHLMFRCNHIVITQDQVTPWYSAIDEYRE